MRILYTKAMATYTLITGASGGIGKELAKIAANEGQPLVLIARNKTALDELATSLSVETIVISEDLATAGAPERVAKTLKRRSASIDTLINNAGFGSHGPFADAELERQEQMLMLNIVALTKLTRLLLPDVKAHKGNIMNVGSLAGFMPGPNMSVYFASKAYVLSFSEALQQELKPHGVGVTCLCPGPVDTGFAANAGNPSSHHISRARTRPIDVATYGWRAMKRRQPVAVYGFMNRATAFIIRFMPRALVRWSVRQVN